MTSTSSTSLFTPISINSSLLVSYYSAKAGIPTTSAASASKTAASAPSAPWSTGVSSATLTAAATKVLNGGAFIDPGAAKLDAPNAKNIADYKSLFALYGGLSALEGLAQAAQSPTLSDADRLRLQSKFVQGLQQVQAYVAGDPFKSLTVTNGSAGASVTSTAGVREEDDSYTGTTLATGSPADPVAALDGDGRFSMTVKTAAKTTTLDFDLSDISGPRTVSAVESYMNGKLEAAGVTTRIGLVTTPGGDQTVTAGGKSIVTGQAPDQLALKVQGVSYEQVSFAADAATAAPAVYVAQTADTGSGPALSLSKLDPTGASGGPQLWTQALPAGVSAVRATATGADGSVYVLADIDGALPDGHTSEGTGSMALLRYDSAGALTYTRTLGASGSATGVALSVSPDGSKVAITGAVTGALDGDSGDDPDAADTVVSVFSAAEGVEQWTTRAGGAADDRPAALAWGADGSLYVAGRTDAGLPGAAATGGTDAYVQGFSATGARTFATVYGTGGTDAAAGLVVTPDGSLVTAGTENGHAVLRRFDPPFADGQAASAVRDLGDLQGGSVSGLGLAPDGSILVAGTGSGGLALGSTASGAYAGGREVFAARLGADLQPAGSDAGTWWTPPGGADPSVAAAVVQGGEVYVTGQVAGAPVDGATDASQKGFAVALDPAAGAAWSRTLTSQDGQDAPAAITVNPGGVSVLDRLGLPSGALDYTGATDLASATSLRAGDSFKIGVGASTPVTIRIEDGDTLDDLAAKINTATGGRAAATVVPSNGYNQLKIAPASTSTTLTLVAGPDGQDALKGLGLSPTLLSTAKNSTKTPTAVPYGLGLTGSYSLADAASAKAAFQALAEAVTTVHTAYDDMSKPPTTPGKTGGTVPAYLTAQIAQYQQALARLGG